MRYTRHIGFAAGVLLAAAGLAGLCGLALVWALNALFGLGVAYSLKTVAAAAVLLVLASGKAVNVNAS
jgi:hypothetical protein